MAILKAMVRGLFPVALLLLGDLDLRAQTAPSNEYKLKAAFLLKFIEFVEWPRQALPENQTPFVIGVLGDDPFKRFLDELVRDEKAGNRPLHVEYFRRVEDIKDCHILFISSSENRRMAPILAQLKGRSVLTVGDVDGFAASGGMIRFIMEGKKIRFRINNEAAKAANLTISSKLLRLAEVLPPSKS